MRAIFLLPLWEKVFAEAQRRRTDEGACERFCRAEAALGARNFGLISSAGLQSPLGPAVPLPPSPPGG